MISFHLGRNNPLRLISFKRGTEMNHKQHPEGEKMKDFFISYNGKDKAWAEWIAWQLEEAGYTTIIQAWDFRPGGNFVIDMQQATVGAKRTIAVLSENYLKALYTQPEWAAAFKQDPTGEAKTLLPVRVEECKAEGILAPLVRINLVGKGEDEARQLLLEGVRVGRAKPTTAPGFPGSKPAVAHTQPQKPSFPPEAATPTPTSSPSSALPRLKQLKLKALEERLDTLIKQYEAANQQLNITLAAANRVTIEQQIKSLEQEIQAVEAEIDQLKS
jgi:hypothetical protein